jgi:hypothetical protein
VDLATTQDIINAAENFLNDLSVFAGGPYFMYGEHHVRPPTKVVAPDLVDLVLLGAVDSLVFVTGAGDRLGASGARWTQHREGFWEAVNQVALDFPDKPINRARSTTPSWSTIAAAGGRIRRHAAHPLRGRARRASPCCFLDPSGNALELKAFRRADEVFAW